MSSRKLLSLCEVECDCNFESLKDENIRLKSCLEEMSAKLLKLEREKAELILLLRNRGDLLERFGFVR